MKLGAKNWREKDVYTSKNSGFILFLLKEMLILAVLLNLFLSLFSELGAKWQPFKSTGKSKKIALLEYVPV